VSFDEIQGKIEKRKGAGLTALLPRIANFNAVVRKTHKLFTNSLNN